MAPANLICTAGTELTERHGLSDMACGMAAQGVYYCEPDELREQE